MFDPAINVAFQQLRCRALDWLFGTVSVPGYGPPAVLFLIILFWVWDKRKAFGMTQLVMCAGLVEHLVKELFQRPRPFQVAPDQVQALDFVYHSRIGLAGTDLVLPVFGSYGFPSGHAMVMVCLCGALAIHLRRRAATFLAIGLVFLTGLSRIYLGVHFLGDVLGGIAIGCLLLALYAVGLRVWSERGPLVSSTLTVFVTLAIPVILFFLSPARESAQRAFGLIGFSAGYFLEERFVGFGTRGSLARKAMRIGLGLAVLAVVFAVLHRLADCVRQSASACCPILSTALVYGVLGLTASLGVAWAFRRCGLAESEEVGLGGQVRA